MKKCPVCSEALRVEEYEELSIWRCPGCRGALVSQTKHDLILARKERSTEELAEEVKTEFSADSTQALRCPRCSRRMDKRPMKGSYGNLNVDVCKPCQHLWFDGGELATAQLTHEISDGAADVEEHKRRAAELERDPERKAAFEEQMKKVPQELPCKGGSMLDDDDERFISSIEDIFLR